MYFGSAWYPEHWPEERWREDVRLMREVGFNVVRVGEFAWSRLEPEDGRFDIDWLVRVVDCAAKEGIVTVIGTPSAAPPVWLTTAHPDVVLVREDGREALHGARCHYSPASATYRRFATRIASEMAKKLCKHPSVIGWQIDNEFGGFSYDDETRARFQDWLHEKHGDIQELNRRWTTAFWSQEYSDWSQIPIPIGFHNPGLVLDWRRFKTDTIRNFQKLQIDAIREHSDPRQWITHNFMGFYPGFDHYKVAEDLDIASWDDYISHGHLDYLFDGAMHDLTRGFKHKNFWVMETQCGWTSGGTDNTQNPLDRGEIRTFNWHQVGHGADALLFFEWRAALCGQESYSGGLVAQDGRLHRHAVEFKFVAQELHKTTDLLADTQPVSQVALLHSYDDRWAIDNFRDNIHFDPVTHFVDYYRPLRQLTHEVDVVQPTDPLSQYKLVVAPGLHIMTDERAHHLIEYVKGGAHLVLGARSGLKDEYDAFLPVRQPGPLAELLGAHVDEFYGLTDPVPVLGELGNGESRNWAELLQTDADDVHVLLRYGESNGWLDDEPAMVTRGVDDGRITYVGGWLDPTLLRMVSDWMVRVSGVHPPMGTVPEGVEVCRRVGEGKEIFIVINHTETPQPVTLPRRMTDVLSEQPHEHEVRLPPLGVMVLV